MGLKEKLQADLTDAIKARNEIKAGTIRMVLAAITTEEVSGKQARVLTDAEIITVLSREVKKRREAIDAYAAANRADLVAKEKSESDVISAYLPEQLVILKLKNWFKMQSVRREQTVHLAWVK